MDRFSVDGSDKKLIYQGALEFIGEVRAGISRDRFKMEAVRYGDAFIDMLNDTQSVREFLMSKGIDPEFVHKHVKDILARLHFNEDKDHYMTLCLPRTAPEAQINRRWKDLMLIYHPDRSRDEEAARCAKRINESYNVLKHPDKKREYDMKMNLSAVAHFGTVRKRVVRPQGTERYSFISPEMRSLLPKLIIPSCLVISAVILLIIFFENRPAPFISQDPTIRQAREVKTKKDSAVPAEREGGSHVYMRETPTSEEFKSFYRAEFREPARVTHTEDAKGRKTGEDSNLKALKPQTPRELRADIGKMTATAAVSSKDPLRDSGTVTAGRPMPPELRPSNVATEERVGDMQTQKNPPIMQGEAVPGPRAGADDTALNERYSDLETEVFLFLVRYIQAYEEGDIAKFMGFFSRSVIENGSMRYEDIKQSYKKNFEGNKYSYTLKNVNIKGKDSSIIASADYTIKRTSSQDKSRPLSGKMHWTLGRENGELKITRMDYDRR